MEQRPKFLHGTLEATIFHATPYSPPFLLNCINPTGKPAYVTIKIDHRKMASTSRKSNRIWNQTLRVFCAHPINATITITLKTKCSILGKVNIQAHQLLDKSSLIDGLFPVCMENGKPHPELKIRFMLWFKPAEVEPCWRKIIDNNEFNGLRDATFPQRTNCGVTLYQDSHHHPTFQPPVDICGSPRKLWEDVSVAIEGAKYLIYIAGWSFNPNMIRMSLWYEHTGRTEHIFQDPESLECVVMMRLLGEQMWQIYLGDEVIDMEGVHLVSYPISVTQEGKVEDHVDSGGQFPLYIYLWADGHNTETTLKHAKNVLTKSSCLLLSDHLHPSSS